MILDYLRTNPDAGDTLEGISKWWLNLGKIDVKVDEVSSFLETLVKERKVKRYVIKGDTPIYKICRDV
ncbi:hypothetical protein S225a_21870 [Candidatus Brocadiaceae bacterium S225]|uniref:Uncharacterized protein n=1 Tax=Candidatus Scalindua brodae TaxID=237368 RepID=A0A0B0EN69_9BACT|nr:MAG: hypothetical protein SCABRO_00857 [Candidatus Scalindua brodae]TWU31241.1 hypothetical protein S225a_21870 [Candidatus Brocadiaceae bacterium S225]